MIEEFEVSDNASASFDIKKFLFRSLSYWKWFLLLLALGVFYVYQKNIREEFSYRLGTKISVEDDSNPLFTSNASLTFNWGGVTSKVQTMIVTLKSHSHHEKVVDRLEFYKSYLKEGRFTKQDIYKAAPFRFDDEYESPQLLNIPIKITCLNADSYEMEVAFLNNSARVQNYMTKEVSSVEVPLGIFKKQFKFGDPIKLPFLKGAINLAENRKAIPGQHYYIQFSNFDSVVSSYQARTSVNNTANSPILDIALIDKNTEKIVDYLNMMVLVLSEDQLNRKNQYATNAINFIDQQISRVKGELSDNANALNAYRKKNKIYSLDDESILLNDKLTKFDAQKESINRQLDYYANLKNYLSTSSSFTDIPAPSIAGIGDSNILTNVSKINALSVEKSQLQYSVRSETSVFNDLNRQIEGLKKVLQENISAATNGLRRELQSINEALSKVESQFSKLPEDQQQLITIQRQYSLSEKTYNVFLAKRGEAEIIKASNVSDILIIDPAKNTGAQVLGRNLNIRYLFSFFLALIIPLLVAFILTIIDHYIHSPVDLEKLSSIPLLGVIGKNHLDDNLVVHRHPKSAVAESFRAIRSNLQYFYKTHDKITGAKTMLVTSSVSGEGKTFCSINVATVFALSGKKTILLGLDLRKPKIYNDFKIQNDKGVVNYLIGEEKLETIIQKTHIEHLDVITSGPVPPNPSELLLSEKLNELITNLKTQYDYIILDSPPIGLVADALELMEYVDASLYVVRQDYTKRDMLNFINEKYKTKQIKNISIVYNGYDQKAKYGYGYGYGYGYNYGYGYGADENDQKNGIISKIIRFLKSNK